VARKPARKSIPWQVPSTVGLLLLIAAVLVGLKTYRQYSLEHGLSERGQVTTGTILKTKQQGYRSPKSLLVRFRDHNEELRVIEMPAGTAGGEAGERQLIRFDPRDSSRARPVSWRLSNWAAGAAGTAAILIGAAAMLGMGHRLRTGGRRRRRRRAGRRRRSALTDSA
jgi:uncharacterized protein DUF3592